MEATLRRSQYQGWAYQSFLWAVVMGLVAMVLPLIEIWSIEIWSKVNPKPLIVLACLAIGILALASLFCLLGASVASSGIRDEEKLSAALALLDALEVDGARKGKVSMWLDLRDVKKCPSGRPGKAKDGKWGPWISYRQRWLRLRAELALKRRLDLRLTRKFRHKLYPKRASCREKQVCVDRLETFQGRVEHRRDTQQSYAQLVNEVLVGLIGLYRPSATGGADTRPTAGSPPPDRSPATGGTERPPIPG